jgi:hypothetical protein
MRHTIIAFTLALPLVGLAASPREAAAASPCKSTWSQLGEAWKKVSPVIAKGVCQWINSDDAAAASKCVADFERAVAEVQKIAKQYNETAESGKIGPRGLASGRTYEGKLVAERTFIGQPIMSDTYTVDFTGTGGKSKKPFTVTICFVDAQGNEGVPAKSKDFTTNDGKWTESTAGVWGLRPIVYLRNSTFVGTDAHRYELRGTEGGEPKTVKDARAKAKVGK